MNRLTSLAKPPLHAAARAAIVALMAASLTSACHRDAVATPEPQGTTAATPAPAEAAMPTPEPSAAPKPASTSTSATAPTEPSAPSPDGLVVLAAGQSAKIAPSTTLRFDRIVNDSRCPANVQCVWAGEVRIALTLTSPTGAIVFELSERENTAIVQLFAIELVSFGACPAGECASLRVGPA